ncbi:MAG: GrpB family protein [Chloroflexi bacterium]|nr:GrpB family protein [Chloroflexota bacterium]
MAIPRPVIIVSYDPAWPQQFDSLQKAISVPLGPQALAIEHVGSTAVPRLPAKPIIDMDVVIASRDLLPQASERLSTLGYAHQGDLGVPGREAFGRTDDCTPWDGSGRTWPEHHLYVCAHDSLELARHLAFRNYLRANPDAARAYAALKRHLAKRYGNDREAYTQGKTAFVLEALRKAMPMS